jgi:hypothetical protein
LGKQARGNGAGRIGVLGIAGALRRLRTVKVFEVFGDKDLAFR